MYQANHDFESSRAYINIFLPLETELQKFTKAKPSQQAFREKDYIL